LKILNTVYDLAVHFLAHFKGIIRRQYDGSGFGEIKIGSRSAGSKQLIATGLI